MADIERDNQHTDILQVQIKQEDGEEPHDTEDRLKSSNTGEQKPCHICPDCGKSYTRSDNLKTHQKIHMTERPYLCSECGKGFTRTDHLKSHLKTHERKKNKLKHPCTDCVKGFVHLEQLEKHLEKNHLTHKEKKPHGCPRCDESFSDLEELTTHLPVHTEELALYCSDCALLQYSLDPE
uniref:C2H2-type domain-containing protein n=1 Tax=Salmo trutta TaxID=8032 RepID=A0A674D5W3_SALTR